MTRNEFAALCSQYAIDPSLALENEAIRDALASKDDALVKQLLETEF